MPFIQRIVEPKYLSRAALVDEDGKPLIDDYELEAVTNNTLSNALRQLASLVLIANDIFNDLSGQLQKITIRSDKLKVKIGSVQETVGVFNPRKVAVPESDISSFSLLKHHYEARHEYDTNLFGVTSRPAAVQELYETAAKTPIHLMRQMDRWRRDGHRSSRFFMCTPVLGAKRRRIRNKFDIDIETRMPAMVEELRRWTSTEALGDITVNSGPTRIHPNLTVTDGDITNGTILSDDEAIDHKLPSPEEQLQVVALKFPAEIVAVDISGKSFDRMCVQRRSLLHGDLTIQTEDGSTLRRRTRGRKPRNRRRNTLAGTDQKEIRDALITSVEDQSSSVPIDESELPISGAVSRSKSSDILRSSTKKESPENKKSHFSTLKQWGKSRLKMITHYAETKSSDKSTDIDDINIYETITVRRKRNIDKERKTLHERKPSCSSSEKSSINIPINTPLTAAMSIAVRLRDSSVQRRLRRSGEKDEPHSSSGNWSASSESGRASIGSEITTTTQPKSTTSAATSFNSLNQHAPSSVNSRRRYNMNTSASGSVTSEGTLTPDIIHDLHEDGETSSVYSCDTEGYYTSFHMDSGLKTLKEEDSPATPLHSTSMFSNSSNNTVLSAENEYELFGRGSTSTTTSSAGTVCTTLRAAESNRSLVIGPAVPERKSSLSKLSNKDGLSPESSLERDYSSDKTGTVKRSPANNKATVIAMIHKDDGDVSPDSGHNTSSSPIESISSPTGIRSCSEFEFSESSDMEGADRIERIRSKTAINSSRIPSMCVITPSQSDDESVKSHNSDNFKINNNLDNMGSKNNSKSKLELPLRPCETNNLNNIIQPETRILMTPVHGNTKVQLINVNPQTGYATIDNTGPILKMNSQENIKITNSSHRAPSPSGGSVTIKESTPTKSPQLQPILKATLLPLNNMLGRLKLNFSNIGLKRDSKSPNKDVDEIDNFDAGEYVTISDVKNNNEKSNVMYANDVVNRNLNTVLSGRIREIEYISLNELPCNDSNSLQSPGADSLERKRRQGARVTLNAEGKVVYSSDSLKRKKGAHTTFEPGPCVKPPTDAPLQSPIPSHRTPKTIRPVSSFRQDGTPKTPRVGSDESQPLSPQLGKVVIRASSGTSEIVRMPPSTIVSPSIRPMSPKPITNTRGAYVHMQPRESLSPTNEEGRALSPSNQQQIFNPMGIQSDQKNIYGYHNPIIDSNILARDFERSCAVQGNSTVYSTLPSRKPQYMTDGFVDRAVTPDIMRGLHQQQYSTNSVDRKKIRNEFEGFVEYPPGQSHAYTPKYTNESQAYTSQIKDDIPKYTHQIGNPSHSYANPFTQPQTYIPRFNNQPIHQNLGIPVQIPQVNLQSLRAQLSKKHLQPTRDEYRQFDQHIGNHHFSPISQKDYTHEQDIQEMNESIKISPIDPRNTHSFHSSTPSSKDLKAATNLESLLSPKKSTMSNEELYAIIHKSKKKMNIQPEDIDRGSPALSNNSLSPVSSECSLNSRSSKPETGYLGEKSRLSWSPNNGEYIDFNTNIDRNIPNTDARSRQSWACSDRKESQTSRLDFKKLLLQHGKTKIIPTKKVSAVEQLKNSKQYIQPKLNEGEDMNILDLSASPRNIRNRKFGNSAPGSPRNTEKVRPVPKLLSPRSQWRFANPRSDVLSSTILEDCHEDESPNTSGDRTSPKNESCNTNNFQNIKQMFENDVKAAPMTASQRLQAQRAQFFNHQNQNSPTNSKFNTFSGHHSIKEKSESPPTLETAF